MIFPLWNHISVGGLPVSTSHSSFNFWPALAITFDSGTTNVGPAKIVFGAEIVTNVSLSRQKKFINLLENPFPGSTHRLRTVLTRWNPNLVYWLQHKRIFHCETRWCIRFLIQPPRCCRLFGIRGCYRYKLRLCTTVPSGADYLPPYRTTNMVRSLLPHSPTVI